MNKTESKVVSRNNLSTDSVERRWKTMGDAIELREILATGLGDLLVVIAQELNNHNRDAIPGIVHAIAAHRDGVAAREATQSRHRAGRDRRRVR